MRKQTGLLVAFGLSFVAMCFAQDVGPTRDQITAQEIAKIDSDTADAAVGSLQFKALQIACPSTPLTCPYVHTDALTTFSCIHHYIVPELDSYVAVYNFQASVGQTITVTMASPQFATYSTLRNSNDTVVAFDERLPGNDTRITYTVPIAGTYTILAEALWPITSGFPDTGAYTLAVTGCAGSQPPPPPPPTCGNRSGDLCLGGRFQVGVDWNTIDGRSGHATALAMTSDTGYFWFFNSANVELVVKVLDGRGVNGYHWVFYGALSNVHYSIRVTDTLTGRIRQYDNVQGTLSSVADTQAF